MIELYTGSVGSGKSYHALRRGLVKCNAWTNNVVVANFPIRATSKREKENWIYVDEPCVDYLIELSVDRKFIGREGYALLIIDEAGLFFNSRDWQIKSNERKKWIKFFSQSRKFGYDVVLIAQDERMIDRQIRSMAEYRVKHLKLRYFWYFKWLPLQVFMYVAFWTGGRFNGIPSLDVYLPWVARKYDTMRLFDMGDAIAEVLGKVEAGRGEQAGGPPGPDNQQGRESCASGQVVTMGGS